MTLLETLTVILVSVGGLFFLTGTIGLLRFPASFSRLHALTKADNVGLGFIACGLALQAESVWVAMKILLVWGVALIAATVSAHLTARFTLRAAGGSRRTPP